MNTSHDHTESIVALRASLVELIAVAVGIAFGVNLLAGALLASWPRLAIGFGTALVVLGAGYLIARLAPRMNRHFSFEGVLAVAGRAHDVVSIDRYEFAEDTARHIRALAAENKALGKAWGENPLSEFHVDNDGHVTRKSSPAVKLAREALEYFVLDELAAHLSGHFENNPRIDDAEIVTVGRREIPSILLENRFLELFSKPMEEREAFWPPDTSEIGRRVVSATGTGGAIFDRFQLILPRGTQVSRVNPNTMVVETGRFLMRIQVVFDGFRTNLPFRFEQLYLGRNHGEVEPYHIDLEIDVRFKLGALLTATGWEYYRWVDSFLARLARAFSFERFLDDIGWSTALTAATVTKRIAEGSGKIAAVPANKPVLPTAADDESGRG